MAYDSGKFTSLSGSSGEVSGPALESRGSRPGHRGQPEPRLDHGQ